MIKQQAERLLYEFGLLEALSFYGKVHITGSCRMDLMCWNDLDLYIEENPGLRENWFDLVHDVCEKLRPYSFDGFFKTERMFLGCETEISGERWNVDIWVKSREQIENAKKYCDDITAETVRNPEVKTAILAIKRKLIALNMYGIDKMKDRHYHSDEIYKAVLAENIRTPEEFLNRHSV